MLIRLLVLSSFDRLLSGCGPAKPESLAAVPTASGKRQAVLLPPLRSQFIASFSR
ncbi:hypothetical protein LBMAG49_20740 [Planctomycetota bacterium]|nr:hypothetical protein LBMAG49_20740 [Planctomycetota bacterium]